MKQPVALVASDPTEKQIFLERLKKFDIQVYEFDSIHQLIEKGIERSYAGFVFEFRSLLGNSQLEKDFVANIDDFFPTLRVVRHKVSGAISGFTGDKVLEEVDVFKYFLENRCMPFEPRGIRKHLRRNVHLSILISKDPLEKETDGHKANTFDLSEEGMFILSMAEFDKETTVYIRICDLPSSKPFTGTVKWSLGWNKLKGHLPGCGVLFKQIGDQERDFIRKCIETGSIQD